MGVYVFTGERHRESHSWDHKHSARSIVINPSVPLRTSHLSFCCSYLETFCRWNTDKGRVVRGCTEACSKQKPTRPPVLVCVVWQSLHNAEGDDKMQEQGYSEVHSTSGLLFHLVVPLISQGESSLTRGLIYNHCVNLTQMICVSHFWKDTKILRFIKLGVHHTYACFPDIWPVVNKHYNSTWENAHTLDIL